MTSTVLLTMAGRLRKARKVNCTNNSYATAIKPAADPFFGTATNRALDAESATGRSVISTSNSPDPGDGTGPNTFRVMFFGTGSDNNTMLARLWAWNHVDDPATAGKRLWVPVLLWEVSCTLSAVVGVAGTTVAATERFADTISLTYGNNNISIDIVSPAADVTAHLQCDVKGGQFYEFDFNRNSSATDCNALFLAY